MQSLPKNRLLDFPPNALEEIRKIHNLDKPGRIDEAVDILEGWIQKQDHIIKKDFSREYLERTLVICKGSVEKAKRQIDRFCTMQTLLPKFFAARNAKAELTHVTDRVWIQLLPKMTKDYYRIAVVKLSNKELKTEYILQYFQYFAILCEYAKRHDYVNGFFVIYDLMDVNIANLATQLNTVDLQQFLTVLMEGYGARMKAVHVLTKSKAVEMFLNTIKPFLSEKLRERVHVQNNIENLYKEVPQDILPLEYNGKERSMDIMTQDWCEELSTEEHIKYVSMMRKALTDESKRRADKFNEQYMGMPGSFRHLSVD